LIGASCLRRLAASAARALVLLAIAQPVAAHHGDSSAHPALAHPAGGLLETRAVRPLAVSFPGNSKAAVATTAQAVDARLIKVDDGDSFVARQAGGARIRVRLAGIDAPERSQPWANRAREKLRDALDGRNLKIHSAKTDRYGRQVALVQVDGEDVSLAMLEAGLAWHFARYDGDLPPALRSRYAAAAAQAREARIGLWRDDDPEPPWQFRRRNAARNSR
jgi:endonuclease YncB( thermonuclease family)